MNTKTIITIVIILLLTGAWYYTQAQEQQQEFVKEHNIKAEEYNALVKEHEKIISSFNTETNPDLILQKAKAYLNWLDQHESTITDFKSYLETNFESLRKIGVNPDYMRDDVKTSLMTMKRNTATMEETIASREMQDVFAEFKTEASKALALLKERTQFITSYELETNPEVRLQIVKNYLDWISQNEDSIIDFKSYLETNSERLTTVGLSPDDTIDVVKKVLMAMREDRANVQIMVADTEALLQLQQRLEAIESGIGQS